MATQQQNTDSRISDPLPVVRSHVGGWLPVEGTARDLWNPADTREHVAAAASVGPEVVAEALAVADAAAPSWARTSPLERGALLGRAAEVMASHVERLATQMTREVGKVIAEARAEVLRSIDVLRFFAQAPRLVQGQTHPL